MISEAPGDLAVTQAILQRLESKKETIRRVRMLYKSTVNVQLLFLI